MAKRTAFFILLITLFSVTSVMPLQAQNDELEELPFFLTFVPNIQFAPVYATIANGHAADVGLEWVIQHGDENVGMDLIANNTLQFGVMSGEQVIMARAGGRPVVYIYEWFQQYPVGIIIPNTTDAETLEDLRNLKVGIPGRFGASYSGLTALLAAHDMDEGDIQLEAIGFAAPDVVCVGGVDATVIYINNEPLQIQQRADAGDCGDITSVSVIRVSDHVDMVSNGLVTNEETIHSNYGLVQDVIDAYHNGLRDVILDPAGAYLLSLDYVENLPINDDFRAALEDASTEYLWLLNQGLSYEELMAGRAAIPADLSQQFDDEMLIQFNVLLATIELWLPDTNTSLGHTDPDSWEVTLNVLKMMEMLPGEVELEGAYTNEFLPTDELFVK